MLRTLLRPWRTVRTWHELTHLLLDVVVGTVTFTIVVTLLATTLGLLVTFVLAVPLAWLLFAVASGLGRVERTRVAALLGLELGDPYPPPPADSWWRRLVARATSVDRWREIGYLVLLLPLGVLTFTVAVVAWCGSAALVALPFVAGALPGGTAKLWLVEIGPGLGAVALGVVGVAGLVCVAPWTTVMLASLDRAVARRLLGARGSGDLEERVRELDESRVAALDSAEAERRRIERDLHDGAQQRLVALSMELGRARARFDDDPDRARELVASAHEESKAALVELRDLVRGIHPAILEDRGLDAALSSVVARSPVPVRLTVDLPERLPPAVESTAYFAVTEALANVAKHARAAHARVSIAGDRERVVVEITDDGVGGADARGAGLNGLADRARALGGRFRVLSPPGGPTTVIVELPCAS